jgi:hypothetical protein
LFASVAIAALALGIYAPLVLRSSAETSSTTTQCGTTMTSTVTTTVTSWSTVTTTEVTSTTILAAGSFDYSPKYPVKIDSVKAVMNQGQNGDTRVTFQVLFENIGSSPVYVAGGCGSGLNSTIPANSPIIQKVQGGPLCLCAQFIMPINPGQNHTTITPGCWSGYYYKLVQAGTVDVNFTLYWGSNGESYTQSNSTSISAKFTLA